MFAKLLFLGIIWVKELFYFQGLVQKRSSGTSAPSLYISLFSTQLFLKADVIGLKNRADPLTVLCAHMG